MAKDKAPEYFTEWTDEMIERFFESLRGAGERNEKDFDVAVYAYHFMLPDTYARFLTLFKQKGADINAKNSNGQTILQYIATHGRSADYVNTLQSAGAE